MDPCLPDGESKAQSELSTQTSGFRVRGSGLVSSMRHESRNNGVRALGHDWAG